MEELSCFLGKWEEQSKDGFDEMAVALNLPGDKIKMYKETKTAIAYTLKDDSSWQIDVGIVGLPAKQFEFELGKGYKSNDLDGTPMMSLVKADGSTLHEEHTFDDGRMEGKQMTITRWIEGDSMKVKTTMCGHSMVSTYKRV
ncbi:fatty acid-binding protein 5-like [Pecten maximus]|uniref:fatty acid-binding protein 5-like n=1 Tax=Pecten maximus TaxID=6579 RepID=UPI00145817B6|nr:fatty acid-binding protein 5-like [Pecten maximus]